MSKAHPATEGRRDKERGREPNNRWWTKKSQDEYDRAYEAAKGPPAPPPNSEVDDTDVLTWLQQKADVGVVTIAFEIDGGYHVTLDLLDGSQYAARNVDSIRDGVLELMSQGV